MVPDDCINVPLSLVIKLGFVLGAIKNAELLSKVSTLKLLGDLRIDGIACSELTLLGLSGSSISLL